MKIACLLTFCIVSASIHAQDESVPTLSSPVRNAQPSVMNQPIVVSTFEKVEMERLRIAEESAKAERDEIDFQKQVAVIQKKLTEASASTIIPESLPTDYRSFLSANAGDIQKSAEYYVELKSVLNDLVPNSPYKARTTADSSNPLRASEKLVKLSNFPEDNDISRTISGQISSLSGGRIDDQRRQVEINREIQRLLTERKRLEWNLKLSNNPSILDGKTSATEDERNFIRQQIEDVKAEVKRYEDEKKSLSHLLTTETRKLQFQQFIVELAIQQRYIHALIACGFYRSSFKGGDLNLKNEAYPSGRPTQAADGNNTSTGQTTGDVPTQLPVISTITGMEAFLQSRIRDAMQERESIDNMLRENQLGAAESLLRKMILTAKYQPELQTIPFQSRQSILQSGRKLRQISDAVNAKDYDEILRLVDSIEANEPFAGMADLKSFANEHPRKALHWARQAEIAMKAGDKKTMSSLMEVAIRRAPLNQEVAQKIQSIQENAHSNNDLLEELRRIVAAGDYRASFERMNEFAPLVQSSNKDSKLKDSYEKLIENEKSLRAALEKTDSLEKRGLMPEAWVDLNALPQPIANDVRVLDRKNRISAECPKFIKAYNKATTFEQENKPAKALAWYLNALIESPGSDAITSKVNLLGAKIIQN
jgi:hypothetical protein